MEVHYCDCCQRPIKPGDYFYQVGITKRKMEHAVDASLYNLESLQERAIKESEESQNYKEKEICCSCYLFFQIIVKLRIKEEENLLEIFEKAMKQTKGENNGKTGNK